MKHKIYTTKEMEELKNSPFVLFVRKRRFIEYDPYFKLWAVYQRYNHPEKTASEIFKEAGFPIKLMSNKLPQARIRSWELLYLRYGVEYFITQSNYIVLDEEYYLWNKNKNKTSDIIGLQQRIYNEVKENVKNEKRSPLEIIG